MLGPAVAPPGAVVLLQRGVEVVVPFFFFFFFLMNGGRRRLLPLAQLRGLYPPPSLREEVKATFTPLRAWAGTVSVTRGWGALRPRDSGPRAGWGRTHLDQRISCRLRRWGGGARGPPTGNLLLFKISGAWGRRGQGPSSLICQKLRKCLLSISKKGRVGGC